MNLFNIGVDGQYRVAVFAGRGVRRPGLAAGLAQRHRRHPHRDRVRRPVGRHRGLAEGQARRLRGHLDDHAQRHRHRPGQLAAGQGARHQRLGQQRHQHQGDPGLLEARGAGARARRHEQRLHADPAGRPRRLPLLVRAGQDPVRLRPARDRHVRDRGRRQRREGPAHGHQRDAALRRRRRPRRHAAAVRPGLLLRHDLPGRPRLLGHRDRPARPQQPRRHRLRARCCGPTSSSSPTACRSRPTSRPSSSTSSRASSCSPSSSPTS